MSKPTNFYEVIPKKYLQNNNYFNWNKIGLQHPHRTIINGASGEMKTNTMMYIMEYNSVYDKIYLISKMLTEPLYKYFIDFFAECSDKLQYDCIEASSSLDDLPKLNEIDQTIQNLIIIDDMICEKKLEQNQDLLELFTMGRKYNCSVIFISQDYYLIPKVIRQNISYIILKRIRNKHDISTIMSDIGSKDIKELYYKTVNEDPLNFFLIDMVNDKLKYRKNFETILDPNTGNEKIITTNGVKKLKK